MEKYNLIIDNTRFDMGLIWQIVDMKKNMPHIFNEKMYKLSFYFMFPYCIWSKSRSDRSFIPFENIESDLNRYEDASCSLFFEFENIFLDANNFLDKYSNLVLNTAQGKDIYAVVYNDDLAKYINQKYPKVKLVQSDIKSKIQIDEPYQYNFIDYISFKNNKGDIKNLQSYILAVNSFCKNSYRCASVLSSNKLSFCGDKPVNCPDKKHSFEEMKKNEMFVSLEEMDNLNKEGIEKFLVKSNSDDRFQILETYVYYLFKPEYQDMARLTLLKSCFMHR